MAKKDQKIAEEDIVRRNELGQNVVVVPKGQPIPEDLEEATRATVPQRHADSLEEEDPKPAKKKATARTENKGA